MRSSSSKCVICVSPVKTQGEEEWENASNYKFPRSFTSTASQSKHLDDHLNVIFVLKHVFELSKAQLQAYLRNWGNPGDWLKLCEKCEEDVCSIRRIFSKYNAIQKKFEKAKWEIQERVRMQEEERKIVGRKKEGMGVDEIFYNSRDAFLRKRKRVPKKQFCGRNPFQEGDQAAANLALLISEGKQNPILEEDDGNDSHIHEEDDYCSDRFHDDIVSEPEPKIQDNSYSAPTLTLSNDDLECDKIQIPEAVPVSTTATLRNRHVLKKVKYAETVDDEDEKTRDNPSRKRKACTDSSFPAPTPAKRTPVKTLLCPVCKTCPSKKTIISFGDHFHKCLSSDLGTITSLQCSFCNQWSCSSNAAKEFMEHSVLCQDTDHNSSKPIPWRHAVLKCNLCEESEASYLPFPDFTRHIFLYHQHKYGCSQCLYRALKSPMISGQHWKAYHSDLLEIPNCNRFVLDPEGTVRPLPLIPWWCPATECLQEFSDEASRDLHLYTCQAFASQAPERSSKCSFCDQSYFSGEELQMHRVIAHAYFKLANAPKCEDCDVVFSSGKQLRIHERRVHGLNLLKCSTCGAGFDTSDKMWNHVRKKHGNPEELKDYTCHICQRVHGHKRLLRKHLIDAHNLFKCGDCGKVWEDEDAFIKHMSTEHQRTVQKQKERPISNESDFCCTWESCGKRYNSLFSLNRHVRISHKRATEKICPMCGRRLINEYMFHYHMERVHGLGEARQEAICDSCGKSFVNQSYLKTHIKLVHLKDVNFHCDVCGKGYRVSRELRKHKAYTHGIGFKCDVKGCSKAYPTAELLVDHKKYKHEGLEQPRPFCCRFCGKGFVDKGKVTHHEKAVHINKHSKPFKCALHPECSKSFATQRQANYHLRHTHKIKKDPD